MTDIRSRVANATWDRSVHSEAYIDHEISDETLDRSIQDWVEKTFVQIKAMSYENRWCPPLATSGRNCYRVKTSASDPYQTFGG